METERYQVSGIILFVRGREELSTRTIIQSFTFIVNLFSSNCCYYNPGSHHKCLGIQVISTTKNKINQHGLYISYKLFPHVILQSL